MGCGVDDWVVSIGEWVVGNGERVVGCVGLGFGGSLGGRVRSIWVCGYGFGSGGVVGF